MAAKRSKTTTAPGDLPFPLHEPPFPLLPARQILLLSALLQGKCISEAAKSAGLSRGFASSLINHDPVFVEVLRHEMAAILRTTRAAIVHEGLASLKVICAIRDRADAKDADRLRAAALVLDNVATVAQTFSDLPRNDLLSQEAFNALTGLSEAEPETRESELAARLASFDASPDGKRLQELMVVVDKLGSEKWEVDTELEELAEKPAGKGGKKVDVLRAGLLKAQQLHLELGVLRARRDDISKVFPISRPLCVPDEGCFKHSSDRI